MLVTFEIPSRWKTKLAPERNQIECQKCKKPVLFQHFMAIQGRYMAIQ